MKLGVTIKATFDEEKCLEMIENGRVKLSEQRGIPLDQIKVRIIDSDLRHIAFYNSMNDEDMYYLSFDRFMTFEIIK